MSVNHDEMSTERSSCPHEPACLKDVREIRSVVFGNGRPEKSLLVRMERVETRLAVIQKLSLATLCGVGTLLLKLVGAWVDGLMRGP
ncbi:MAG: hypothetical protein IPM13_10330 [Phycisphaerales bacterium]|nr:hypothetical protein [Phycisphaerales bacterium]